MIASIPEGWRLVPVEPTPEMLDVAVSHALCVSISGDYGWSAYMRDVWSRMLTSAPPAPSVGGWVELTDEDRERAMRSMPDMLEGFMKTWGWLHYAKAIEAICREKNALPQPPKEKP